MGKLRFQNFSWKFYSWYLQYAVHSGRNSLGKIFLPVSKSNSFFASLVFYESGIRNIQHICLTICWSRPFWSGITKYKSNESYNIYFEFRSDTRTTKCMLKQNIILLLWQPRNESVEGSNTLYGIRCRLVVQRINSQYNLASTPRSLWISSIMFWSICFRF